MKKTALVLFAAGLGACCGWVIGTIIWLGIMFILWRVPDHIVYWEVCRASVVVCSFICTVAGIAINEDE